MDAAVTIARFKESLAARGYSKATVTLYAATLSYFNGWLAESGITDLMQVNARVLAGYQAAVGQKPLSGQTKAVYIRSVKRLFEELVKTNQLLINPAEGLVEIRRAHDKLLPVLSQAQVKRILEQPNLSTTTGVRDRAILEVLYATAIRRGELLNLCIHDVDLQDKVLYIRQAKNRIQRVAPLTRTALWFLKEYLDYVRPGWAKKAPKERRLFLLNTGAALNGNALQAMIRTHRLEAKIKQPVSAHTFRRSCATHMLRSGADIRYVQALLGHRSLKTTQIYTRVAAHEIKQTHNRNHPGL
jgi:integrase/recombinase XerD